jgi:hypothetical protein
MQKKSKILFYLLLLTFKILASSDNYKAYYFQINRAEVSICNTNYALALMNYDSAFSNVKIGFACDYYNAVVINTRLKKYDTAILYCEKLVQLGCDMKYFALKNTFKPLRITPYWQLFIQNYPQNRKLFEKRISRKDRIIVEQWLEFDQSRFRLRNVISDDSINKTSWELSKLVKIYLSKNNYPSEKKIGIFISNDTIIENNSSVIFRHFYQTKNFEFTPILQKAVFKGLIRPEEFIAWHDIEFQSKQKKSGYGTEPYIAINGTVYFNSNKKNIENINTNRLGVYAESFDDYCKKIIFQKFTKEIPDINLIHYSIIATYNGLDKESEAFISRNLIKTEYK